MKKNTLSDFTLRLIRENEAAIKVRMLYVTKTQQEIEGLKKQNRDLMGRESHDSKNLVITAASHETF